MPNKASAKKALRQNKKRAAINQMYREKFRNAVKKAAKANSAEEFMKLASLAQKALDKAAKHGTIKKNTASRKLSRLMKKQKTAGPSRKKHWSRTCEGPESFYLQIRKLKRLEGCCSRKEGLPSL